jgi:hypothetical protein
MWNLHIPESHVGGHGSRIEMNETVTSPWITTAEAAAYPRTRSTNSSAVGAI